MTKGRKRVYDVKDQNSSADGFSEPTSGFDFLKKHILTIKAVFDHFDVEKKIYPNGVFGAVREESSLEESKPLTRIELFAEDQSERMYGIIRTFPVALTSENCLLELAQTSNSVIAVRVFGERQRRSDGRLLDERLILKQAVSQGQEKAGDGYRKRIPDLLVSPRWLERMNLDGGDRIVISNPIESYLVPPPSLHNEL